MKLAILICNYNKSNYLKNCIESVKASSIPQRLNWEMIIVDNCSEDDSREYLSKLRDEEIKAIYNEKNLGGSGGFNTGLRQVIDKDYDYVMLLDNDAKLDENCIATLLEFLETHQDYGMVGSLLLSMDHQNIVQELGADIDFEQYYVKPYYKNANKEDVPELVECDYVPACCLMVRIDALRSVGLMDEENFIYWDDIEWGYKFKLAGYKVGAYSKAIAWHKMGVATRSNTFGTYYFWRNRVKFFLTYITDSQIPDFCEKLFEDAFKAVFMSAYSGRKAQAKAVKWAIEDALNEVEGKAKEDRIIPIEEIPDKLYLALKAVDDVIIEKEYDAFNGIHRVENKLDILNKNIKKGIDKESDKDKVGHSIKKIKLIKHILEEKHFQESCIYIDEFMNIAYIEEDFYALSTSEEVHKNKKEKYLPLLITKAFKAKESLCSSH